MQRHGSELPGLGRGGTGGVEGDGMTADARREATDQRDDPEPDPASVARPTRRLRGVNKIRFHVFSEQSPAPLLPPLYAIPPPHDVRSYRPWSAGPRGRADEVASPGMK